MDEYIFSPLEWEEKAKKEDNTFFCKIRDYESTQGSLKSFIKQEYTREISSYNGIEKQTLLDVLRGIPGKTNLSMCAAKWSRYRQIYSFDRFLLDYLLKNVNVDSINANMMLYKLPFPAFYVRNIINIGNYCVEGFYVYLNKCNENNIITLEVNLVCHKNNKDNALFFESFTTYLAKDGEYSISKAIKEQVADDDRGKNLEQLLQAVIILITYLCTDKVDIVRRKEEYTPRNSKNKKPQKADLKLVGAKTARIIKERKTRYVYEDSKEVTGDRKGKPKAAHFRSAHYHSFWTGKRDEPEKRQLIVKLLDPIFVNGNNKEIPVTERKVVNEGRTHKTERNTI